jgi:GNAT superfamily N-acetyltransferase
LDSDGLDEAIEATPSSRFRVATRDGRLVGYAVTGRAGSQGFLQRLATDPDHAGTGIGTALVLDALRWATRRRVRRVLVNTQNGNRRALDLYRRIGFEPTPTDLVVLTRSIP